MNRGSMTFHAPDGAKIAVGDFEELSDHDQFEWCEEHGANLSLLGDMQKFALGVPAVYEHLFREGILVAN